ncbi:hypothetical protein R1sor_026922 [Riccia sorocarpa]|uniref:DUF659 domain-containing protein n=1 Tax=Riccia sorocarpa TaxID=122646 RepID=A0ABD3GGY0_9MARC
MDTEGDSLEREGVDKGSPRNNVEGGDRNDNGRRSHPKSELSKFVMLHFRQQEDGKIQCILCNKAWKSLHNITRLRDHFVRKSGSKSWKDQKWALAQEMTGMPFRTFVHLAMKEAYQYSSSIAGYKFPSEKKLRTVLLDTNYAQVKDATEKRMWDHTVGRRATMSCDGWINVRGRPLLNIMYVGRHGEILYKHVDGSNTHKDSHWVADAIIKAIEEVGPENILQFTADNAPVNKLAGFLIRSRYSHIIFGGCVAHGLDLVC